MTARVQPLRVRPASGEAIDSWLETIACRMDVPLGALVDELGLPRDDWGSAEWVRWLSAEQLRDVAVGFAVSEAAVEAMTMAAYDGVALTLDPESHRLIESFPYGASNWSRYCPDCLSQSGGRWPLSWRLGWSFACVAHSRLLADRCPECGRRQRHPKLYTRVPAPTFCHCGCRLSRAVTMRLPEAHPIIDAQRLITAILNDRAGAAEVFPLVSAYRREVLEAVRSLSNRILTYAALASSGGLMSVPGVGLEGLIAKGSPADRVRAPWGTHPPREGLSRSAGPSGRAPARSLESAVGTVGALNVLRSESLDEAASRARWMVRDDRLVRGRELLACRLDGRIAAAVVMKAWGCESDVTEWSESPVEEQIPPLPADHATASAGVRVRSERLDAMWPTWSAKFLPAFHVTAALRAVLMSGLTVAGGTSFRAGADVMRGGPEFSDFLDRGPRRVFTFESWDWSDNFDRDAMRVGLEESAVRDNAYWGRISTALLGLGEALNGWDGAVRRQQQGILVYSLLAREHPWDALFVKDAENLRDHPMFRVARQYLLERLTGFSWVDQTLLTS